MEGHSGELLTKLLNEREYGFSLLRSASVLGLAVLRKTANITDTNTDGIVTGTVSSYFIFCSTYMDWSVSIDDEVVANAFPAFGFVPAVDVGNCVVVTFGCGWTMNDDFVCEVSNYPCMEDLMIISDMLISDYSSVFFDYSIMPKPMLAFCYDYDRYASERGMYFDIRERLPAADNEDELLALIKNGNTEEQVAKTKAFQQKYVTAFGSATKHSLDVIAKELGV